MHYVKPLIIYSYSESNVYKNPDFQFPEELWHPYDHREVREIIGYTDAFRFCSENNIQIKQKHRFHFHCKLFNTMCCSRVCRHLRERKRE